MKRSQQFTIAGKSVEVIYSTTVYEKVKILVNKKAVKVFDHDYGPPDVIYDVVCQTLAELEHKL